MMRVLVLFGILILNSAWAVPDCFTPVNVVKGEYLLTLNTVPMAKTQILAVLEGANRGGFRASFPLVQGNWLRFPTRIQGEEKPEVLRQRAETILKGLETIPGLTVECNYIRGIPL